MKRKLRISEARVAAIINSARDCIFIKDLQMRYVLVNPSLATLFQKPVHDMIGTTDEELLGKEVGRITTKSVESVLKGETLEEEYALVIHGELYTFLGIKTPLYDENGAITGYCGISRNVTERSAKSLAESLKNRVPPSSAMRNCLTSAKLAAAGDSVILLTGESGTGKDYIAQYVHSNSQRVNGPFFSINCAALAEQLAETELFGHESGAFTGAQKRKRGLLELAEGGTLLLNEIGEMSPRLQSKLLTFLETKTFTRVGGEKVVRVDARIIAATNRKLEEEVAAGRFRLDLYYRINVLNIVLPPLRNRLDDLSMLCDALLSKLAGELNLMTVPQISVGLINRLKQYHWPGNIRELKNVLERALILSKGNGIREEHLFGSPDEHQDFVLSESPSAGSFDDIIMNTKRELIVNALRSAGGKRKEAAKLLGMTRDALKRQMKTTGLMGKDELLD